MLRVAVQGAHGDLHRGAGGDALPQHFAVLRRLPREPAATHGSPPLGCRAEIRRSPEVVAPGGGGKGQDRTCLLKITQQTKGWARAALTFCLDPFCHYTEHWHYM